MEFIIIFTSNEIMYRISGIGKVELNKLNNVINISLNNMVYSFIYDDLILFDTEKTNKQNKYLIIKEI